MADEITIENRQSGVLVNPTAVVLSDSTGAFGIRRSDTLAVVVAHNTPPTGSSGTGRYYYDVSALDKTLSYEAIWKVTPTVGSIYYVRILIPVEEEVPTSTAYIDLLDANTYFSQRLHTEDWDYASDADRTKALIMATKAIDRLNFNGDKADEDQEHEFPRGTDTSIPQQVQDACCELALSLLSGIDPDLEFQNLGLLNQGYANVRSTYDRRRTAPHIAAGIPSVAAWRLLLPFLRDPSVIEMSRVS